MDPIENLLTIRKELISTIESCQKDANCSVMQNRLFTMLSEVEVAIREIDPTRLDAPSVDEEPSLGGR